MRPKGVPCLKKEEVVKAMCWKRRGSYKQLPNHSELSACTSSVPHSLAGINGGLVGPSSNPTFTMTRRGVPALVVAE